MLPAETERVSKDPSSREVLPPPLAVFLESAETTLFAQLNYLAISALWLVLRFRTLSVKGASLDSFLLCRVPFPEVELIFIANE